MKKLTSLYIVFLLTMLGFQGNLKAQVSHGGRPLPLSLMRSTNGQMFKEMPPFDVQEELRIDSLNESDLRSGFRFAYKFITDYNRYNSGVTFTGPDGTRVWRLGIYSPGALSINVLFTEYELPEGAQLFLYNEDQTQILGSFNHLNNSELNLLPVSPIQGDRLIIEYQEPANASFQGRLTVGEVNHGYRSLRGLEPGDNTSLIGKIPPLACYQDGTNDYAQWGQSVVLLIIDGSVGCTGTLINNTDNDGKPYLLTASHCLNKQFTMKNPDYEKIAGSIVCFFNFNSPFCDPILRGTEEMSTASTYFKAVNEMADMALLELTATPPVYYRPYYAGWNAQEVGPAPYTCIQHPQYSVKRISISDEDLAPFTLTDPNMIFYENAHLHVKTWEVGYTASGSSGSPLFNADGEIIGALSGGQSSENSPKNDYFFSLKKPWDAIDTPERQLKYWLNPSDDETKVCEGLDPYKSTPCFRLSNIYDSGNQENAECTLYPGSEKAYLFGNNPANITEYAEAYQVAKAGTLYGAYFVTPPAGANYKQMEVEVTVYSGDSKPSTLLYTETFQPTYSNKSILDDTFIETAKSLNRSQESYIHFSKPVNVSGKFYIGYKLKSVPENTYFSAYNLPKGKTTRNTAWVHDKNGWRQATEYTQAGFSTSLFIDPVIQYGNPVSNEKLEANEQVLIHLGPEKGMVHLVLPDGIEKATYTLHSAQGKVSENGEITDRQATLHFLKLTSGVYFLTVHYGEEHYTQKIIFLIKKYTIRVLGNHPLKRMARGTQPYFFNNSTHILCIKQA